MASGNFRINASPSADAGYNALNSELLTLQLEDSPGLDIFSVAYSVSQFTKNAPALTFSNPSPQPPTSPITVPMPATGVHSYVVRAIVNGGVDARGEVVPGFTRERLVAIRSSAGFRKIAPAESAQFDPQFGWTDTWNEQIEAVAASLGSAAQTSGDKDRAPLATAGDEQSTGLMLSETPSGDRYVGVFVNRLGPWPLGDGVKTKDCYFSRDGGATALPIAQLVAGDQLFWNGTIAGFNLAPSDSVDMLYEVGGLGATNDVFVDVRNETGMAIAKGKLVSVSGFNTTHDRPLVQLADKDDAARRPAIGVTVQQLANNANGSVLVVGTLVGVDTSMFALTDQLMLGDEGAFSRPPPDVAALTGEVQLVGSVTRVHATLGRIAISLDGLDTTTAAQVYALAGTSGAPGDANRYVTSSDPRLPTQPENDALQGTSGAPANANRYVTDADPRNANARTPTGAAGGQLSGTYPNPEVVGIKDSGGNLLSIGAIANGQFLQMSGGTIVGVNPSVYGNNFANVASDGLSSTTSLSFQNKVTIATGALTGTFMLAWSCQMNTSNSANAVECRLQNTTDAATVSGSPNSQKGDSSDFFTVTGFGFVTLSGTSKNITIQWRTLSAATTANILVARIAMWRVS